MVNQGKIATNKDHNISKIIALHYCHISTDIACFCKLMAQNWHKISLSCAHGTDLGDVFNIPELNDHATTDVSVWMSWAYLAWQFWESLPLTEFSLLLQVHQLLSVFQQADQGLLNLNWIAIFYRIIVHMKTVFYLSLSGRSPRPTAISNWV